jgi:hypothetical protein
MLAGILIVCAIFLAGESGPSTTTDRRPRLRVASFNIWELTAGKLDRVDAAGQGTHPQLRGAAEIIQRVRPDVLLINEIDYATDRDLAGEFCRRYLAVPQGGTDAIDYPHVWQAPVNTGLPSGHDLDNDGKNGGPGDALGYGRYPGQYGMAVLSRLPIDRDAARTFQRLRWQAMPDNLLPDGTGDRPAWYSADEARTLPLSSKSHWDIPILWGTNRLHLLCAHPTPPVFDGPEDRNGRRNHDEIRLLVDYISPQPPDTYLVDDAGRRGPLPADAAFVVLGDLNADPARAAEDYGTPAITRLLNHPRIQDPAQRSAGALGKNPPGPPYFLERKTCDFGRIDYALPSKNLEIVGGGVFWPGANEPGRELVAGKRRSSDHRMVWVDVCRPPHKD